MKVSIKWIEVLLIALIAIAALAIWTETEQQLSTSLRDAEPNEIVVQQTYNVQSLQADLAVQQKRLDSVESRLRDRQADQLTQATDLQALTKRYPQLVALSIGGTPTIPVATLQAYVQARREVSETMLLVNQLEADFNAAVDSTITLSATQAGPLDASQQQSIEVQLQVAEALRDSLQTSLVEARLKLPVLSAKIASLEGDNPQLTQLSSEQQTALSLPSDVVPIYVDAQHKQVALDVEIATLTGQAQVQQTWVVSQTIALAQAERDATQDLAKQQEEYVGTRRGKIAANSLFGWLIEIVIAIILLIILRDKEVSPRWGVVVGGAAILVLALLIYPVLQNLGAVIALGIVSLFVAIKLPSASAAKSTK